MTGLFASGATASLVAINWTEKIISVISIPYWSFIVALVMGYAHPSGKNEQFFVFIRDHNFSSIVSIEFYEKI